MSSMHILVGKLMKVEINHPNSALVKLMENPEQIITLDANFLIPPDRKGITERTIRFKHFQEIWLDPIFSAFSNLAIHEAVYDELVDASLRKYIDRKKDCRPSEIIIHSDSTLSVVEEGLRESIEGRLAPRTRYDPLLDNKDDRGEVKSLAFIAVKNLLYFAAHDNNAILLIEKAEEWLTGLDNIQAIRMYELIYYLFRSGKTDKKAMKMLYKYQYFLTGLEKKQNPEWGDFAVLMDKHYDKYFEK